MRIRRVGLILLAGIMTASCSEKSAQDGAEDANKSEPLHESEVEMNELRPEEDKIAEDCLAFVRSTKVVPTRAASADCPTCPAGGTEALRFSNVKTAKVSCSGDTCNVLVTIRAAFNPGAGEAIAGGLTAWIPPEERSEYLSGRVLSGEQAYRVQITYQRRAGAWQAVEFDRAPNE